MTRFRDYIPTGLSLVLIGALISLFVSEASTLHHTPLPSSPDRIDYSEEAPNQGGEAYLAKVVTVSPDIMPALERPLFSETRRVFQQPEVRLNEEPPLSPPFLESGPVEIEAIVQPSPPNLTFKGFVKTANQYLALILVGDTGAEKWLGIGEEINGWTIKSISENQLNFRQNGFEYVAPINQ